MYEIGLLMVNWLTIGPAWMCQSG